MTTMRGGGNSDRTKRATRRSTTHEQRRRPSSSTAGHEDEHLPQGVQEEGEVEERVRLGAGRVDEEDWEREGLYRGRERE
jgi:hypothetical protein